MSSTGADARQAAAGRASIEADRLVAAVHAAARRLRSSRHDFGCLQRIVSRAVLPASAFRRAGASASRPTELWVERLEPRDASQRVTDGVVEVPEPPLTTSRLVSTLRSVSLLRRRRGRSRRRPAEQRVVLRAAREVSCTASAPSGRSLARTGSPRPPPPSESMTSAGTCADVDVGVVVGPKLTQPRASPMRIDVALAGCRRIFAGSSRRRPPCGRSDLDLGVAVGLEREARGERAAGQSSMRHAVAGVRDDRDDVDPVGVGRRSRTRTPLLIAQPLASTCGQRAVAVDQTAADGAAVVDVTVTVRVSGRRCTSSAALAIGGHGADRRRRRGRRRERAAGWI